MGMPYFWVGPRQLRQRQRQRRSPAPGAGQACSWGEARWAGEAEDRAEQSPSHCVGETRWPGAHSVATWYLAQYHGVRGMWAGAMQPAGQGAPEAPPGPVSSSLLWPVRLPSPLLRPPLPPCLALLHRLWVARGRAVWRPLTLSVEVPAHAQGSLLSPAAPTLPRAAPQCLGSWAPGTPFCGGRTDTFSNPWRLPCSCPRSQPEVRLHPAAPTLGTPARRGRRPSPSTCARACGLPCVCTCVYSWLWGGHVYARMCVHVCAASHMCTSVCVWPAVCACGRPRAPVSVPLSVGVSVSGFSSAFQPQPQ